MRRYRRRRKGARPARTVKWAAEEEAVDGKVFLSTA